MWKRKDEKRKDEKRKDEKQKDEKSVWKMMQKTDDPEQRCPTTKLLRLGSWAQWQESR